MTASTPQTPARDQSAPPPGQAVRDVSSQAISRAESLWSGYSNQNRPLKSFAGLTAAFNLGFAGCLYLAKKQRRKLPDQMGPADLLLLGVATHKFSRLISRDTVLSFARAPFVRYKAHGAGSEVAEEPRGDGFQLAVGELVTCPYCVGQWVAATLLYGLVFAPRVTRFVSLGFTALTISDGLHLAYSAGLKAVQPDLAKNEI